MDHTQNALARHDSCPAQEHKYSSKVPPRGTTFHQFGHLPPELRQMIWEAAAQPPPCAHLFGAIQMVLYGRDPNAYGLKDAGLWKACRESRWAVQRAYMKRYDYFSAAAWPGCFSATRSLEMQRRRLARLYKSVDRLAYQSQRLDWLIEDKRERRTAVRSQLAAKRQRLMEARQDLHEMEEEAPC